MTLDYSTPIQTTKAYQLSTAAPSTGESVYAAMQILDAYARSGAVSARDANALASKIESAGTVLADAKPLAAKSLLQATINQVRALGRNGRVSAETAAVLEGLLATMISQIN